MSFFYDLNKKLDSIRATPEVTHQQLNERDMKKTGKLEGEGASKAKMAATRKKFNQYDNEEVKEESGEWSKIPVGVIDGPGGYDGAQQRIKDYESGNINRDGKTSPPVVDRSRPADKPTVYDYRGQPEESLPPVQMRIHTRYKSDVLVPWYCCNQRLVMAASASDQH